MRPICRCSRPLQRQFHAPPLSPALSGKNGKSNLPKPVVTLDLEASGRQRDELLVEVAAISSFDDARRMGQAHHPDQEHIDGRTRARGRSSPRGQARSVGDRFGEPLQVSEAPTDGPNIGFLAAFDS